MAKEKIELGPTGRTVAENLRRLRAARGMSLRELAEKAERAGRKFGVNALSQAEKGQRRLDIDDVVALAAVLDANPNALMLPVEVDRDRPVGVTGAGEISAFRAWAWMSGDAPLRGAVTDFRAVVLPWWIRDQLSARDVNDLNRKLTADRPESEQPPHITGDQMTEARDWSRRAQQPPGDDEREEPDT